MAKKNGGPTGGGSPEKKPNEEREFSTFRCYAAQGEKLNELARIDKCSVADVIERLDGVLDDLLIKRTEARLQQLKGSRDKK